MGNCVGSSRRRLRAEAKRMKREERRRLEIWQRHVETLLNAQASSIRKLRDEKEEALSDASILRLKLEQLEEVLTSLCENNKDLHQSLENLYTENSKSATKCRRYKKCVSDLQAEVEKMQSMLVIREEMRDEELDPIKEELQKIASVLSEVQTRKDEARNKEFENLVRDRWDEFNNFGEECGALQKTRMHHRGSTDTEFMDIDDIDDVDLHEDNADKISVGSDGYFEDDVFYGCSYPLSR